MPLVITIGQVEGPAMRKAMRAGKASAAHPGFEAASKSAARKAGVSEERGRAIIAAGTRKASPTAVRRNPRLARVSGVKKPKKGGGEAEA
jgi:hypothetical protein